MPTPGQVQHNSKTGEYRRWTGDAWEPHAPAQPIAENEPGTWWGGFTKHLLEKEPATLAALGGGAAMATGGAGLLGPAAVNAITAGAPAASIGLQKLSQLLYGDPVDPLSAGDVATAASGPLSAYGGPAIGRVAGRVGASPVAQKIIGAAGGMLAGGTAGQTVGHPFLGAMLGEQAGQRSAPYVVGPIARGVESVASKIQPGIVTRLKEMWAPQQAMASTVTSPAETAALKLSIRPSQEIPYRAGGSVQPLTPEPPSIQALKNAETFGRATRVGGRYGPESTPQPLPGIARRGVEVRQALEGEQPTGPRSANDMWAGGTYDPILQQVANNAPISEIRPVAQDIWENQVNQQALEPSIQVHDLLRRQAKNPPGPESLMSLWPRQTP